MHRLDMMVAVPHTEALHVEYLRLWDRVDSARHHQNLDVSLLFISRVG